MNVIDASQYLDFLRKTRRPWQENYLAMYSSVLNGVVKDPLLMQVPMDDHLVHRGDGVFDMFKCVGRGAFNMDAHLARLLDSAKAIGLEWKPGVDNIRSLVLETLRLVNVADCSVKVMISRGPGSLGVNPYDCPEPSLYIIVYAPCVPFMKRRPDGAVVRRSTVPVKEPRFATAKNCNYLPNVMMARESADWGCDFVVAFDDAGHMAEGATENFGIVSREGDLFFPRMDNILHGTTMLRVMHLAEKLVAKGMLKSVAFHDITPEDIDLAGEMVIVGTTIDVVGVRQYEDRILSGGKPGPIALALNALLETDILSNPDVRTSY